MALLRSNWWWLSCGNTAHSLPKCTFPVQDKDMMGPQDKSGPMSGAQRLLDRLFMISEDSMKLITR